jgi:hypothetical protein
VGKNSNNVANLRTCESDTSTSAEMREKLLFIVTVVDTGSVLTAPIKMVVNIVTKAY